MILRDYQIDAVNSVYDYFATGGVAPLIVTPTGSGKSVILAEIIHQFCQANPGGKVLVITHVKELVEQDAAKIQEIWYARNLSSAPMGIYSAGMKRREIEQITVASIQSIYRKEEFYGAFDLVIVDEAHLIPRNDTGMYSSFLTKSAKANPNVKLIGLTATPYRLQSGMLHEGDEAMFDGISYEANLADLVKRGYLSRLTCKHGATVDLRGVKRTAGEFNLSDLGQIMSAMDLVSHHCDAIVERCQGRKAILVFAVTVEHARAISTALKARGVASSVVTGDMSAPHRDAVIGAFKDGRIRALVNCQVLTTGFDYPAIDAVVMLRPTLSPGLYVQMAGRGLRVAPSKEDCLIVDFGGNVIRHGFIDAVMPPRKKSGVVTMALIKRCPECNGLIPLGAKVCPQCEYVFPVPEAERKSTNVAYEGPMMSTETPSMLMKVKNVSYSRYVTKSGIPAMRVSYYVGIRRVDEYICLEHPGFARTKADHWWRRRNPDDVPPGSVEAALERTDSLKVPHYITVNYTKKFPEIVKYEF